jgi:hypothetical protein
MAAPKSFAISAYSISNTVTKPVDRHASDACGGDDYANEKRRAAM